MIWFILFVAAVLGWDALKKKLRGSRKPKLTVRMGRPHMIAQCGCEVRVSYNPYEPTRVIKPCAAHRLLLSVKGD